MGWSLHGKTFSLVVSGWHVSFYRPVKVHVTVQVCVYADGWVRNFFPYRSPSLSVLLILPSVLLISPLLTTPSHGIRDLLRPQRSTVVSFPMWQCKMTIDPPCWLNNCTCYVGPGKGDVSKVPLVFCRLESLARMYPYTEPMCKSHSSYQDKCIPALLWSRKQLILVT